MVNQKLGKYLAEKRGISSSGLEVSITKNMANFGVFILSRLKRGVALRPPRSSQRTAEPTARGIERKVVREKRAVSLLSH